METEELLEEAECLLTGMRDMLIYLQEPSLEEKGMLPTSLFYMFQNIIEQVLVKLEEVHNSIAAKEKEGIPKKEAKKS